MQSLRRFYPLLAFFGGFAWDALTIGQKMRPLDFARLGAFLCGAALLLYWLAHRERRGASVPQPAEGIRGRLADLRWQAPYLLLQFFYGGIFSALFILYFKSAGHLGTWLAATLLGILLVANEFVGRDYGRRFTLAWALFALNAILLFNFALPHALGSLDPRWFYVSTATGGLLTGLLRYWMPGRPGRILPACGVVVVLLLAWWLDMIAPVPLVKRDLAAGHDFSQTAGRYVLGVEEAPRWQFWREQSKTVHLLEGERLYGVSAIYAPLGVGAALEHRWEVHDAEGWRTVSRARFQSAGGRERGFRGYSWVSNPSPGEWRLVVATQDGRTIGMLPLRVERAAQPVASRLREF